MLFIMRKIAFIFIFTFILRGLSYSQEGDAVKGELISKRCAVCHDFSAQKRNKVGPPLFGIYAQAVGKTQGYQYSAAIVSKGGSFIWDDKNLDGYLKSPKDFMPSGKMAFLLTDATERKDIIAYLKTVK